MFSKSPPKSHSKASERQIPDIKVLATAIQLILQGKTPESAEGLTIEMRNRLKGLFAWLGTEAKKAQCPITPHAARAIAISNVIPKRKIPSEERNPDDDGLGYIQADFDLALALMGDEPRERDKILEQLIIINPDLACPIRHQLGKPKESK